MKGICKSGLMVLCYAIKKSRGDFSSPRLCFVCIVFILFVVYHCFA